MLTQHPAGSPWGPRRPGVSDHGGCEVLARLPRPGLCILEVDGELDLDTAALLSTAVAGALRPGLTHLILDLGQVRFLGVRGLAVLHALAQAVSGGVALHLCGTASPAVRHALARGGLPARYATHPTLAGALAAVGRDRRAAGA